MAKNKRLAAAQAAVEKNKSYALNDAIALIKSVSKAKFDETVEMSMNLGIDPRHADQMVRGLTSLPNGTGKTVRVGVFAPRPMRRWPPAPTWWARTTWPRRFRPAKSTSTAASPPPT
jgi:ribosomal protein L1